MAGEVGTAYVRVRPNVSAFQAEASSGLSRAVKGIAVSVAGAFAAQKVFAFGKEAISAAAQVQKSSEFIQSAFGNQAKALTDFADTAANKFAISKDASEAFSAQIGLLAQQNGIGQKKAAGMSLEIQKLAGSFALIKGTSPTPYLDALSRALLGNTRGLKLMGIAVNSANELQQAQRLGFIQTTVDAGKVAAAHAKVAEETAKVSEETKKYGATSSQALGAVSSLKSAQDALSTALAGKSSSTVSSLTAAQKAQVILGVATQHLGTIQQEAAKHSGDFANQQQRLSAEMENAKTTIGEALLPVATQLATMFANQLPGAIHATETAVQNVMTAIDPLLPPIVSGLKSVTQLLGQNKIVTLSIIGVLGGYKAVQETVTAADELRGKVLSSLNNVLEVGRASQAETVVSNMAVAQSEDAMAAQATVADGAVSAQSAAMGRATAQGDILGAAVAQLEGELAAESVAADVAAASIGDLTTATDLLAAGDDTLAAASATLVGAQEATAAATQATTDVIFAQEAALAAEEAASLGALSGIGAFGAGLVALAGGALPLLVGGLAIAAGAYLIFGNRSDALGAANDRLSASFQRLDANMALLKESRTHLASVLSSLPEDRMALAEAKLNVQQARANLNNKELNKTALQRKGNELALREALLQQHGAQHTLNVAENASVTIKKHLHTETHQQITDIADLAGKARSLASQARAQEKEAANEAAHLARTTETDAAKQHALTKANAAAVKEFTSKLLDNTAKQKDLSPTMRHNVGLLVDFAKKTHAIPSTKQINFILNIKRPKETLAEILDKFAHGNAPKIGEDISHAFGDGMVKGLRDKTPILKTSTASTVHDMFKAAKSAGGISSPSTLFMQGIGIPIMQGIQQGLIQYDPRLQATIRNVILHQMHPAKTETTALGDAMVSGILQPIQNNLGTRLGQAITSAANAAIASAKAALKIHSPSLLFSEQIGTPISDGILHGMGGLKAGLISEIQGAARKAASVAGAFGGPTGTAATGANERLGQQMMLRAGFAANQWGALQALWTRESGWNQFAKNASSGAYGIPQSLPASKMASAGNDWMTNPATQIAWGLSYIRSRYGDPAGAWAHEGQFGWYDQGGTVPGRIGQPQLAVVHGGETILPTHKDKHAGGVNIDQLTVVTSSPHLWGQASDVVNAIARKVQR